MFRRAITFPLVFEILIWLIYVGIYKYAVHLANSNLPRIHGANFPYLMICWFSICSTIYIIPYYRWIAPKLLDGKKYLLLLLITAVYFLIVAKLSDIAVVALFAAISEGMPEHSYFLSLRQNHFLDLNMVLTDVIAFLGIGLARFSYKNEQRRHQIETEHLHLQLAVLKNQLQPHFLFNTLNSLYGMSLANSKDTPRFILLLSQMMQYILYDCDQDKVDLTAEIEFLNGYFELEQKKFPDAQISFKIIGDGDSITIPPMLFLPLVENSFKHGKHKIENQANVVAELVITSKKLLFVIKNDMLQPTSNTDFIKGGIGLKNIKKRLELYYAKRYHLEFEQKADQYIAELKIDL